MRAVERIQVLAEVPHRHRARDRDDPLLLHEPAQRDLCRGPTVIVRDRTQDRIVEDHLPAEWAVGGEEHPGCSHLLEHEALRQVGVVLDLVGYQTVDQTHRLRQQRRREVGDADRTRETPVPELRHRAQRLLEWHGSGGPVDQQDVDVVRPEPAQALSAVSRTSSAASRAGGTFVTRTTSSRRTADSCRPRPTAASLP